MATKKEITAQQKDELLDILKVRFEKNTKRHPDLKWQKVQKKIKISFEKNQKPQSNFKREKGAKKIRKCFR